MANAISYFDRKLKTGNRKRYLVGLTGPRPAGALYDQAGVKMHSISLTSSSQACRWAGVLVTTTAKFFR